MLTLLAQYTVHNKLMKFRKQMFARKFALFNKNRDFVETF